jgi:arylsulfatase A
VKKKPNGPIELYDLSNDLSEEKNIADKHPKIVNKMGTIMKEVRTPNDLFKLLPSEQ